MPGLKSFDLGHIMGQLGGMGLEPLRIGGAFAIAGHPVHQLDDAFVFGFGGACDFLGLEAMW